MLRGPRILRRYLSLLPPDIEEARGDRHLLVWGGLPYWMVVDGEMRGFLTRLDGTLPLGDLATAGESPRELAVIARTLVKQGVLDDPQRRVRTKPALSEPKIESIAVNITSQCNLQCAFCYARDGRICSIGDEISADEAVDFLRSLKPMIGKPCSLVILGGEPFLEPEKLFVVAGQARRLGLTSIVSSNGTLITSDMAVQAARVGLQVQVSIDGADSRTHDRVRSRGAFEKALRGVRELVQSGVYTIISLVCHRGNIDQLEGFFELAAELGVNEARFIPLKLLGAATESGLHPVPMQELVRAAHSLFKARPEFIRLLGRDALSILANTCRYSARRFSCGTGRQTVLLDADGALYPCLNLNHPDFRLASIRDNDYNAKRVWGGSPVLGKLREDTSIENPARPCSHCPVRHWCLGGCRGETFAATGDVSRPAPNCAELRRTMLDMMWILTESPEMIRPSVRIC
jgi:radical SAM protein with 4Fe4S-binding SPASM domain